MLHTDDFTWPLFKLTRLAALLTPRWFDPHLAWLMMLTLIGCSCINNCEAHPETYHTLAHMGGLSNLSIIFVHLSFAHAFILCVLITLNSHPVFPRSIVQYKNWVTALRVAAEVGMTLICFYAFSRLCNHFQDGDQQRRTSCTLM